MTQKEVVKRDNLVVEFLRQNKGKENCKSSREISQFLIEKGYKIKPENMGFLLTRIINERLLPICSLNGKGYYWAKNKEDILACVSHLKARIVSLQEHINILESFIIN